MPVLGAKVRVPVARRRLVVRPRLTERLTQRLDVGLPRLVLVAAPAGFGKTTLLSQWLTSDAAPRVAWLSLDAGDADPRRFLAHLVAAVQRSEPDAGVEALALLGDERPAPAEAVLVSLVGDLDALAGPTVLVLDDYHVVDDPGVHEALAFLVDNLPPAVALAMTTRADPPLPLARMRARGDLFEVRAADLRFTTVEAAELLDDLLGRRLDPVHVAALEERTEGWAAGLQLAALSARSSADVGEFVDAFSGSHRFVLDYLVDEVLHGQGDDVRAFLHDTSVLDQLCGPLCDALTGGTDGQQMLEQLERSHLFVVPLDDTRQWYRYHHLFADALRARLASGDDGEHARDLHRKAARWYADRGQVDDALPHAVAGHDQEHVADLVELALPGLRRRREDRELRRLLRLVPEDVAAGRPLLATGLAWASLSEGDLEGVEAWLDRSDRSSHTRTAARPTEGPLADLARARDAELRGVPAMNAVYRASVSQARGDVQGTVAHARRARDLAEPDDHLSHGAAAGFLGLAAWARGDLREAVDVFTDAVDRLHDAGNLADVLGSTVVLASIWLARGRPDRARAAYEGALGVADRQAVAPSTTGDLHVGLADVLREQGELDAAETHLRRARELGDLLALPENRFRRYAAAAGVRRARGDLVGALALLDDAAPLVLPGYLPDVQPLPGLRARVLVSLDRLPEAWDWARRHAVTLERPRYLGEHDALTLARLHVAQARTHGETASLPEVIAMLDGIAEDAAAADRRGSVVEAHLVRSLAKDAAGEPDGARTDLATALRDGVPVGYRRLFLDEGEPVLRLLRDLPNGPASRVLEHAATAPGRTTPPPPAGLSDREVEVLRLLTTDLTGPEIARHLFVSLNTLRTHTKHIFTKLDVGTRRAAVRRAGELGLL